MKVDELVKTCDCDNLRLIVDNKQVVLGNYHEYLDKKYINGLVKKIARILLST